MYRIGSGKTRRRGSLSTETTVTRSTGIRPIPTPCAPQCHGRQGVIVTAPVPRLHHVHGREGSTRVRTLSLPVPTSRFHRHVSFLVEVLTGAPVPVPVPLLSVPVVETVVLYDDGEVPTTFQAAPVTRPRPPSIPTTDRPTVR